MEGDAVAGVPLGPLDGQLPGGANFHNDIPQEAAGLLKIIHFLRIARKG